MILRIPGFYEKLKVLYRNSAKGNKEFEDYYKVMLYFMDTVYKTFKIEGNNAPNYIVNKLEKNFKNLEEIVSNSQVDVDSLKQFLNGFGRFDVKKDNFISFLSTILKVLFKNKIYFLDLEKIYNLFNNRRFLNNYLENVSLDNVNYQILSKINNNDKISDEFKPVFYILDILLSNID